MYVVPLKKFSLQKKLKTWSTTELVVQDLERDDFRNLSVLKNVICILEELTLLELFCFAQKCM
jgi:hypothetical protein